MKWEDWEEQYRSIVSKFHYDVEGEKAALNAGQAAAGLSSSVLKGEEALAALSRTVGECCLVTGAGPSLGTDILSAVGQMSGREYTLVAADGSCGLLGRKGILPDIVVTDLDGDLAEELKMSSQGALMVIHFHGDNYEKAADFVKNLKGRSVVTTQAGPTENTFNFGGYTDGDRAVLLCEEFGAKRVILAGFDFGQVEGTVDDDNIDKLLEAKRIVEAAGGRGIEISRPNDFRH